MVLVLDNMTSLVIGYVLLFCFIAKNIEALSDMEKSKISSQVMSAGIQCIKDYPLTVDDIEAFKRKTVPNENNAKCFTACMFRKVGIMDDTGMLSPADARKTAEQVFKGNEEYLQNVDKIMQICSKVNEENATDGNKSCDRAILIHSCLVENAPKLGFDFDF